MQQAHVYIDGFFRFTPKELLIIESLLKTVDKVTIALSVDYENLNELDELDLFHQTTETYQNLKALAKEIEVVEEEPVLLSNEFSNLRSEEHTSELQSRGHLVCRLLLVKKKNVVKISTDTLTS